MVKLEYGASSKRSSFVTQLKTVLNNSLPFLAQKDQYTGRFIMFPVITNIYNKKAKEPTLMELFTATGKLKKFYFVCFLQLEMFDVCTTVTRHHGTYRYSSCCHTRFNMLKRVWQQLEYRIDVCRVTRGAHIELL